MSLWSTDPNNHMDLNQRYRSSPRLSRHNRTWELESNRADPKRLVAFDPQFLQQLRHLPDELEQLKRHFDSGTKSTLRSEAWNDKSQYQQWNTREESLKRKYEEEYARLEDRYKKQLRKETDSLQRENENLREQLEKCKKVATEKDEAIITLKRNVEELQQRVAMSDKLRKGRESDGGAHELQKTRQALYEKERELERLKERQSSDGDAQELRKTKQILEEKEKELKRLKERHAAISERRVRSDQRKSENIMSTNRQSQLESDFLTDFKDGTRADAVELITNRAARYGRMPSAYDGLKSCRLACLIFETAYECAVKVRNSFEKFTATTLEMLSSNAPTIGLERQFRYMPTYTEGSHKSQDALSEVMILVKEEAKRHDLNVLIDDVKKGLEKKWKRDNEHLPTYDFILQHNLENYIKYCTKFAWLMVSQVPPLEIEYKDNIFNPRTHVLSQLFSFDGDQSRTRRILCYLWPTLQDCQGKVLVKGEVILG